MKQNWQIIPTSYSEICQELWLIFFPCNMSQVHYSLITVSNLYPVSGCFTFRKL